jgi:GNAT superfamily N-acetyltransferase
MTRDVHELNAGETHLAYAAMLELRPNIGSQEAFTHRVDTVQRPDGYRLVASFDTDDSDAAAVAGFRTIRDLVHGLHLYVDDLSTRESFRKRGHAEAIMRWVFDEAKRLACDYVTLDSGVHRHDAHRFYLKLGMIISSHHFHVKVKVSP